MFDGATFNGTECAIPICFELLLDDLMFEGIGSSGLIKLWGTRGDLFLEKLALGDLMS